MEELDEPDELEDELDELLPVVLLEELLDVPAAEVVPQPANKAALPTTNSTGKIPFFIVKFKSLLSLCHSFFVLQPRLPVNFQVYVQNHGSSTAQVQLALHLLLTLPVLPSRDGQFVPAAQSGLLMDSYYLANVSNVCKNTAKIM